MLTFGRKQIKRWIPKGLQGQGSSQLDWILDRLLPDSMPFFSLLESIYFRKHVIVYSFSVFLKFKYAKSPRQSFSKTWEPSIWTVIIKENVTFLPVCGRVRAQLPYKASSKLFFFFFFFLHFIYLLIFGLVGLWCFAWAFPSCGEQGLPLVAGYGLLIAEHRWLLLLRRTSFS